MSYNFWYNYSKFRDREKENFIMKKTLVALGMLTTLLISAQTSWAACPCSNPCPVVAPCAIPCAPVMAPCQPACPVVCPAAPCVPEGCKLCTPKCKCSWWKIFQDKTCCNKTTNCKCGLVAKRAHWYAFWTDRCVVKQGPNCCDDCNDNCKCNDCDNCSN